MDATDNSLMDLCASFDGIGNPISEAKVIATMMDMCSQAKVASTALGRRPLWYVVKQLHDHMSNQPAWTRGVIRLYAETRLLAPESRSDAWNQLAILLNTIYPESDANTTIRSKLSAITSGSESTYVFPLSPSSFLCISLYFCICSDVAMKDRKNPYVSVFFCVCIS